jgi:hypothetical protein
MNDTSFGRHYDIRGHLRFLNNKIFQNIFHIMLIILSYSKKKIQISKLIATIFKTKKKV